MNQWQGQQLGDILFLDGNARITWQNMVSPYGIQQLVRSQLRRFQNQ